MTTRILIVDDEFGLADVLSDLLGELGYDVALAINGKLGLATLQQQPVNLVLVDLMMPVMDGPEMIRRMRADATLAKIPTILMTALPEAIPDPSQYDAVLVKPFRIPELMAALKKLLP